MQRFCKCCKGWHDLDESWPDECLSHWGRRVSSIQIIKDIDPYRAVAGDVAQDGRAPVIGSRSDHREFLKRNGYIELGNEKPKPRAWDYGQEISPREIKQTIDQLKARR